MIAAALLASVMAFTPTADDVMPPLTTDKATAAFMECVSFRESRNMPNAVSATGKHRGKYQATPAMARGMAWHLLPWLKTWHADAKGYATQLRNTPMNMWPEAMQDAAFILTLHHDGKRWAGWQHWFLSGSPCNRLVPVGAR